MTDSRELLAFLTEEFPAALQQMFPEISSTVTGSMLAGVAFRTVRLMGKLLFEVTEARESFVMGQPIPLPELTVERHPDEIRAFFDPRPWYADSFEKELENVGDHYEYLAVASQVLPAGDPPQDGGKGYLSPAWSGFPWMAELFQELWEREQYGAIVTTFQALPETELEESAVVETTGVYIQAQLDIQNLDRARLETYIQNELLPRVREADIWEDDSFWERFGDWVDTVR